MDGMLRWGQDEPRRNRIALGLERNLKEGLSPPPKTSWNQSPLLLEPTKQIIPKNPTIPSKIPSKLKPAVSRFVDHPIGARLQICLESYLSEHQWFGSTIRALLLLGWLVTNGALRLVGQGIEGTVESKEKMDGKVVRTCCLSIVWLS